jgi:hypothetical protein
MRRAANDALSHKVASNYYRSQVIEAVLLTDGLLQTASSWDNHIRRHVIFNPDNKQVVQLTPLERLRV